eukprot:1610149-Rhodomonas_salina.1
MDLSGSILAEALSESKSLQIIIRSSAQVCHLWIHARLLSCAGLGTDEGTRGAASVPSAVPRLQVQHLCLSVPTFARPRLWQVSLTVHNREDHQPEHHRRSRRALVGRVRRSESGAGMEARGPAASNVEGFKLERATRNLSLSLSGRENSWARTERVECSH